MRWALSMRRKLRWCMPNWWTTPLPMPSTTWAPTLWGLWSITHPSPWPKCCQWWTRSSIRCTRLGPAWTVPEVARLLLCPTEPRVPTPNQWRDLLGQAKESSIGPRQVPVPQRSGFGWFGTEQPSGQAWWGRSQDKIQSRVWPAEEGRAIEAARVAARDVVRVFSAKARAEGVPVRTLPHPVHGPRHVHHPHGLPRLQRPTRVQHLRPLQQRSLRVLLAHRPRRTHLSLRIPRTLAVS